MSTLQRNNVHVSTLQSNKVHVSTLQRNNVDVSTLQRNKVHVSTIQRNKLHHVKLKEAMNLYQCAKYLVHILKFSACLQRVRKPYTAMKKAYTRKENIDIQEFI